MRKKPFYELTPDDLKESGWRKTAGGEWTNNYFCEPGGSGLCFSFGQAQLYEGFVQYRGALWREKNLIFSGT